MSHQLISRSPDLKRLRDDGFNIQIRAGYLVIRDVPYVNGTKKVILGTLISELRMTGDVTDKPLDHVIMFAGEYPCLSDGAQYTDLIANASQIPIEGDLVASYRFSRKPPSGAYDDYYHKVTTYINILLTEVHDINPSATARMYPAVPPEDAEYPFNYLDTASSRAGIAPLTEKLALGMVAIIGLGGTGSYVLDLIAKAPIKKIHLYDGDRFLNHNAFRAPGAPSLEELGAKHKKVHYLAGIYGRMHRGIVPHEDDLSESNLHELEGMGFVFLCLDQGDLKRTLVAKLEEWKIPFIDVGLGIELIDAALTGIVRVTTSTPERRAHVWDHIKTPSGQEVVDPLYTNNIQIADLNALNAALAVIKWKKLCGFYHDQEREFTASYVIGGNMIINEEREDA